MFIQWWLFSIIANYNVAMFLRSNRNAVYSIYNLPNIKIIVTETLTSTSFFSL